MNFSYGCFLCGKKVPLNDYDVYHGRIVHPECKKRSMEKARKIREEYQNMVEDNI